MPHKLTLSMDEDLIRFAHELARKNNESISAMVAAFLRGMQKRETAYQPRHPFVKSLYGFAKNVEIPADKKALREELLQRHLK
jgi:hypothetical protein